MAVLTACQGATGQPTTSVTSPTTTSITVATTTASTTTTSTIAPTSTSTTIPPVFHASVRDVTAERLAHSHTPDCPVSPEEVVLIQLVHWGMDHEVHQGAIVVARKEAESVVAIFAGLFEMGYPIQSVIPIGDLPEGVEDDDPDYNNTSGLHCRRAVGSTRWSEHARGLAIDINPLFNPYSSSTTLWPANSERFLDRSIDEPGMIATDGPVVALFAENGWQWGGNWSSLKDYHHFSTTGR